MIVAPFLPQVVAPKAAALGSAPQVEQGAVLSDAPDATSPASEEEGNNFLAMLSGMLSAQPTPTPVLPTGEISLTQTALSGDGTEVEAGSTTLPSDSLSAKLTLEVSFSLTNPWRPVGDAVPGRLSAEHTVAGETLRRLFPVLAAPLSGLAIPLVKVPSRQEGANADKVAGSEATEEPQSLAVPLPEPEPEPVPQLVGGGEHTSTVAWGESAGLANGNQNPLTVAAIIRQSAPPPEAIEVTERDLKLIEKSATNEVTVAILDESGEGAVAPRPMSAVSAPRGRLSVVGRPGLQMPAGMLEQGHAGGAATSIVAHGEEPLATAVAAGNPTVPVPLRHGGHGADGVDVPALAVAGGAADGEAATEGERKREDSPPGGGGKRKPTDVVTAAGSMRLAMNRAEGASVSGLAVASQVGQPAAPRDSTPPAAFAASTPASQPNSDAPIVRGDQATLLLDGGDGTERIRVSVRGSVVHATILTEAVNQEALVSRVDDLRRALGDRGFTDARVAVRVAPTQGEGLPMPAMIATPHSDRPVATSRSGGGQSEYGAPRQRHEPEEGADHPGKRRPHQEELE